MCRIFLLALIGFVNGAMLLGAQGASGTPEDRIIGTWSGTWQGDSTGKFTMTISRESGKFGGTVTTIPDSGQGYTATLRLIVMDGPKVSIRYDAPDGDGEVAVDATVDASGIKGRWQALDKAKAVTQSGTFVGTKR